MNGKILEIRDEGTCMPVLALQMKADDDVQSFWLRRCGYPRDGSSIVLVLLNSQHATNDPFDWGKFGYGVRTMPNAHQYIIDHWNDLKEGDVVDVAFILGEEPAPRPSERVNETVTITDRPAPPMAERLRMIEAFKASPDWEDTVICRALAGNIHNGFMIYLPDAGSGSSFALTNEGRLELPAEGTA